LFLAECVEKFSQRIWSQSYILDWARWKMVNSPANLLLSAVSKRLAKWIALGCEGICHLFNPAIVASRERRSQPCVRRWEKSTPEILTRSSFNARQGKRRMHRQRVNPPLHDRDGR